MDDSKIASVVRQMMQADDDEDEVEGYGEGLRLPTATREESYATADSSIATGV